MQLNRRESVEALAETIIAVLLTLFQIVGTLLQLICLLVLSIYRSVERFDVNRGTLHTYFTFVLYLTSYLPVVNVIREGLWNEGEFFAPVIVLTDVC